jgi:hypothetical protein
MPVGEAGARPEEPRSGRWIDIPLELLVLGGGLLILARVLLRGFWHPHVAWAVPPVVVGALLAVRVRRGVLRGERNNWRPGRWLSGVRTPTLVLAGCFLVVVALVPPSRQTLGADGANYLQQMSDVILHGRLSTQPGIEPGATILQAPFFVLGHAATLAISAAGGDAVPDGTGLVYRSALRLGSAAYGLLAAALAWFICRRFFPPTFSAVCVGGVWLSSTLFHYSVAEPGMTHAAAAALASLLLLLWLRAREKPQRAGRWIAVALVGGLLVSTQRYDVYLLLPAVMTGAGFVSARWQGGDVSTRRRILLAVAGAAGAFTLALLPLVFISFALPGGFLLDPQTIGTTMLGRWDRPHIGEVLFSSNRGLFAWTPVALLGTIGLVVFARRERRIAVALLATLALGVVVLGSNPTWSAGWSFGARRFTEAFAILALGFNAFATAALRRPRVLGAVGLVGLIAVNLSLSFQYRWGAVGGGDTVSFTRAIQEVVADVYGLVGHPPSWPANWLFAARYGVGPDRFDDLYGQLPRAQWRVRLGTAEDAAILGRGWSGPYGESPNVQRWAQGTDATLLFTLPGPVDRRLVLEGAAAWHSEGRVQGIAVEVNGEAAGRLILTTRARRLGLIVPASLWSEGLNEVCFRPEWVLSPREAWETGQPPYGAWYAADVWLRPEGDHESDR